MIEALIITLREGVEAALVVCLLLAAAEAVGRPDLKRPIFLGVAAALLASLLGASLLRKEAVNEELFEGILMLVAAVMVGSMMLWMWRTSRFLKKNITERVGTLARKGRAAALGLFALSFFIVVREGVEAVLFLTAATLSSSTLAAAVGGGLGLVLAIAFGVAFARGSLRMDLTRFFAVTGLVLSLLVVQLLIGGVHELGEAEVIPVSKREMAIVGPIVKNNVLFILAVVLAPLFFVVIGSRRKERSSVEAADPNLARKQRARTLRERRLRWATGSLSLLVALLLGANYLSGWGGKPLSPGRAVAAVDGAVEIPLSLLETGVFHRFTLDAGGTPIRFIAVRSGSEWRMAFDACEICGAAGYNAEAGAVICRLCDSPINAATIGRPGGCNPVPLPFARTSSAVRIAEADLRAGVGRFKNTSP
jgi:FTR1 family protein